MIKFIFYFKITLNSILFIKLKIITLFFKFIYLTTVDDSNEFCKEEKNDFLKRK
jgi:hypothetical protein